MKAYLIDPVKRSIEEVTYSGDYKEIYTLIGAQTFEIVGLTDDGDCVYIDEEGLLTNAPLHMFALKHFPNPLAGRGLVLT